MNEIIFKYRIIENSLSKLNDLKIRKETKGIIKKFLKNNKSDIKSILNKNFNNLNSEEESLFVRANYKIYLKKGRLNKLCKMKKISKKVLLNTIISEFING